MAQPPEELLQDGPASNVVSLEIRVCVDAAGCVWSLHKFATPDDEEKARGWAGGGIRQIAHALLTEALRRETFVCALVEMSRNPDFLAKFLDDPQLYNNLLESTSQLARTLSELQTTIKVWRQEGVRMRLR